MPSQPLHSLWPAGPTRTPSRWEVTTTRLGATGPEVEQAVQHKVVITYPVTSHLSPDTHLGAAGPEEEQAVQDTVVVAAQLALVQLILPAKQQVRGLGRLGRNTAERQVQTMQGGCHSCTVMLCTLQAAPPDSASLAPLAPQRRVARALHLLQATDGLTRPQAAQEALFQPVQLCHHRLICG